MVLGPYPLGFATWNQDLVNVHPGTWSFRLPHQDPISDLDLVPVGKQSLDLTGKGRACLLGGQGIRPLPIIQLPTVRVGLLCIPPLTWWSGGEHGLAGLCCT